MSGYPGMPLLINMGKRHYIFTNKQHSTKGIMSTVLGLISLVGLAGAIYLSFRNAGEIHAGFGFTGVFAFAFSFTGLILGALGIQDTENYRIFPYVGIVLNILALAMVGLILFVAI